MKYYDLSPPISQKLAVFPGDQAFERRVALSFANKNHLELSSILSTLHLGAHADGPSHYREGLQAISERNLGLYMGAAQVVRVSGLSAKERVRHLPSQIKAPRVLVDTQSFPDPNVWNSDFCSFAPELLHELADQGVRLVGIDTPSVDPEDSKALASHQVLAQRDLAVLEGLVLKGVPEGLYTLIALPLPIVEGDASPVRAILLPSVAGFPELV
jgi:arylformamidase